jgi:hypothetical protein
VGQGVAYADILPIITSSGDTADEDVLVESAVIDGASLRGDRRSSLTVE